MFVILADAKHVDEAHAFLNYILEPEVIAKATNFVNYANANKDASAIREQGHPRQSRHLSDPLGQEAALAAEAELSAD